MSTPYVDELALISKNNEGISEIIAITTKVDGVSVPVDLTGYTFFAQARSAKSKAADLICEIQVEVYGDPTEGQLLFSVSDEVMRDVNKCEDTMMYSLVTLPELPIIFTWLRSKLVTV